ncbi:MAG: insulinase family protein, partial [Tidjanibacter sp.]|nr:insulinase family protein [Tidjanibacter sp.]
VISTDIYGLDAENVLLAWRLGGYTSDDALIGEIATGIINNGYAGLIDLNINQQQKALSAYGGTEFLADYGIFELGGRPKTGQSLEEVAELLLAELDKLRKGEWDESLIEATVNQAKIRQERYLDSNDGRADQFVTSFINGSSWEDEVNYIERLSQVTKEDVIAWANEKLGDNSYAIIYKRRGVDPNEIKIAKPAITPIATNRDAVSPFLAEIQNTTVKEIEPVFLDFEKDLSRFNIKNDIEVLYKENTTTDLFELSYVFETGSFHDPLLSTAVSYFDYIGTSTQTPEELAAEIYRLACNIRISVGGNRTRINISGLQENMAEIMEMAENWVADCVGNEAVLEGLKADRMRSRANAKLGQSQNQSALQNYVAFGPEYIKMTTLTDEQLMGATSDELLAKIKNLLNYEHRIVYYGPASEKEVTALLNEHHNTPAQLTPAPEKINVPFLQTPTNKVYLAQYDAAQIRYMQISNRGEKFNPANDAELAIYNEYFGGGMNAIVFQEMREARGLAYSSSARLVNPQEPEDYYTFQATIATQNDKMADAIDAFDEIINDMPESEAAFNVAKSSLISRLRTTRTIKSSVLWAYITAQDQGIDYDRNRDIYEGVQSATLESVKATQQKWVKDRTYHYAILGDIKALDMEKLKSLGEVTILSQEEIFGY